MLCYIGPGGALSAIGSFLALLAAVFLALLGFVWYPIKRMLRARKAARAEADASTATANATATERRETERRDITSKDLESKVEV